MPTSTLGSLLPAARLNSHSINQSINDQFDQTNQSIDQSINQLNSHPLLHQPISHSSNHSIGLQSPHLTRSAHQPTNQSVNHSINQSINRSIPIAHPLIMPGLHRSQSLDQPMNQSTNLSPHHSPNESMQYTTHQSIHQPIHQPVIQSTNRYTPYHPSPPAEPTPLPLSVLPHSRSATQPINQSTNQSTYQPHNQSISQSNEGEPGEPHHFGTQTCPYSPAHPLNQSINQSTISQLPPPSLNQSTNQSMTQPPNPSISLDFMSKSIYSWSRDEVWAWLHSLNLGFYPAFYHRCIDGDMLCDMTDNDLLVEMKIEEKFHRGKILKKVKQLTDQSINQSNQIMAHQSLKHQSISQSTHQSNHHTKRERSRRHHHSPNRGRTIRSPVRPINQSTHPQVDTSITSPVNQSLHPSINRSTYTSPVGVDRYDYYVAHYEVVSAIEQIKFAEWKNQSIDPLINQSINESDESSRSDIDIDQSDSLHESSDPDICTQRKKERRRRRKRAHNKSLNHSIHQPINQSHHDEKEQPRSGSSRSAAHSHSFSHGERSSNHDISTALAQIRLESPHMRHINQPINQPVNQSPVFPVRPSLSDMTISSHQSPPSTNQSSAPMKIDRIVSFVGEPKFVDEVQDLSLLNEGAGGHAYKGYYHSLPVVVKLPKSAEISGQEWREWQAHLKLPNHPNLVHFIGAIAVSSNNYLVTQLVKQGSLKAVLHRDQPINQSINQSTRQLYSTPFAVIKAAIDVSNGLHHLHSHKIVHRDISSRNILVDGNGCFIVGDLGLCREMTNQSINPPSTDKCDGSTDTYEMSRATAVPARWTSPEALLTSCYTSQSDVWSLGVTLWEMTSSGSLPYSEIEENLKVITAVANHEVQLIIDDQWYNDQSIDEFGDLGARVRQIIARCLERDSKHRPNSKQLHDYVVDQLIDWSAQYPEQSKRLNDQWKMFHEQLSISLDQQEAESVEAANRQTTNQSNNQSTNQSTNQSVVDDDTQEHIVVEGSHAGNEMMMSLLWTGPNTQ